MFFGLAFNNKDDLLNTQQKFRLGLSCLVASLFCWSFSIYQTNLDIDKAINYLGLLSTLPPLFYISILLMIGAVIFLSQVNNKWLMNVVLIILMIFTSVYIAGGHGAIQNIGVPLRHFGAVSYISENGHFDNTAGYVLNWPSTLILFSSIFQISGIEADSFDRIITTTYVALLILYFLPLLILIKTGKSFNAYNKSIIIMLFSFFFWIPQHYFSPQGVAYFSYVLILYCFAKIFIENRKSSSIILITILLLLFLVTSHFLTSVVVLVSMATLLILSKNWKRIGLIMLGGVAIASWPIYTDVTFFSHEYFSRILSKLMRIDKLFSNTAIADSSDVAQGQIKIVYFRLAMAIILTVLTAIACFVLRKDLLKQPSKSILVLVITIIAVFVLLGPLYGIYGFSGEMMQREYIFLLPLFCWLIFQALKKSVLYQRMAIFSLFIIIPLFFMCKFGNVQYYISHSHLAGNKFINNNVVSGSIIQDTMYSGGVYKNRGKLKDEFLFSAYNSKDGNNHLMKRLTTFLGNQNYVLISEHARRWYLFLYNDTNFINKLQSELERNNAGCIYESGDYEIDYIKK